MVYRPGIDDKLCFVLMPFGHPFDSYYQKIIKPAVSDAGLSALRSDEIYSTKAIVKDIWNRIWAARVVVADVTDRNPNVNYELGLCDALGVPTVIITANIKDVPFDYKHRRCICYNREDAGWDDRLRKDLTNTIRVVIADGTSGDEFDWPYDTNLLKEPSSAGVLMASGDSRKIVVRGAKLVRDAIAGAFGPHGASVAISQTFGASRRSQRGAQIARGVKSLNPLEEKGIEQIRGAAYAVYDSAGDGSKLAAILTSGFMTKGQELIEKGFHPKDVLWNLEQAVDWVLEELIRKAQPVRGTDLLAVAIAAAGGNRRAGALVAEAMKRAGKDGIISVEASDMTDTTLEIHEGMRFDRGYLSEYFVTNVETLECVLEDCLILVYQRRMGSMKDLLPLLEQVARADKSLLIVAEDVEGEALATLTVNKIKGTLRCAAVRAPGEGDRRKALLDDIAVLTGGKFLSEELGLQLVNVQLRDLGKAEKVTITKNDTTIIGGAGSNTDIQNRVRAIQTQIVTSPSAYDKEKLQERLAMLAGSVAVIKVGGVSESDIAQEMYSVESAMHSTRSAIERGWVIGGGVALLRAGLELKTRETTNPLEADTNKAVAAVLEEPLRQLVENAQKSPTQTLAKILKSGSPTYGFNAHGCKVEDLSKARVLDSIKPITLSLRVALSHAGSVLQTGAWDLSSPAALPHNIATDS